jgi:glycosyltransferase involved in cell wall biosynthesis
MHIAFDAKRLFFNATGLGNYSRSLVRNIRKADPSNEITLFTPTTDQTPYSEFLQGQYDLCEGNGKFLWRLKNMVKDLSRLQVDIYHGLSNELPVGIEQLENAKSIVTIHDLIFLRYPEFYPLSDRVLYREKSKRACKKANHIIAISEATKADIMEFYQIPAEKISVIYQACNEVYYDDASVNEVVYEGRPFLLFVSSITERKNLKLVLKALKRMPESNRPFLKIVGQGGRHEKKMKAFVEEIDLVKDVEFMGKLDDTALRDLYRDAIVTVYPSLYEGFGIPIVESMLMGTPVITSNVSSMPEAAGGLATLIDPTSVEELESAILSHLNIGSKLSQEEVAAVKAKFNPMNHAKEVLKLYQNL